MPVASIDTLTRTRPKRNVFPGVTGTTSRGGSREKIDRPVEIAGPGEHCSAVVPGAIAQEEPRLGARRFGGEPGTAAAYALQAAVKVEVPSVGVSMAAQPHMTAAIAYRPGRVGRCDTP